MSNGLEEPFFKTFLDSIASSEQSLLLMDFDGTIAPYRVDPMKSRPWTGMLRLIRNIEKSGRTRIIVITGRPACEAEQRLGLHPHPEIWGLHGAERLYRNGRIELPRLSSADLSALGAAMRDLQSADLRLRIEAKANAMAVHWRGRPPGAIQVARARVVDILSRYTTEGHLSLMEFDGGIELRTGRRKGDAIRQLLTEIGTNAPVAYLGDDTTDEDGFRAIRGRGVGILARHRWHSSEAWFWLPPPKQLRAFLREWLHAVRS